MSYTSFLYTGFLSLQVRAGFRARQKTSARNSFHRRQDSKPRQLTLSSSTRTCRWIQPWDSRSSLPPDHEVWVRSTATSFLTAAVSTRPLHKVAYWGVIGPKKILTTIVTERAQIRHGTKTGRIGCDGDPPANELVGTPLRRCHPRRRSFFTHRAAVRFASSCLHQKPIRSRRATRECQALIRFS